MAEGPIAGQLFPRDLVSQMASVPVGGVVTAAGMNRVHLVVTRNGAAWWSGASDLNYSGGFAPFLLVAPIRAGLHDYSFQLLLEGGGGLLSVGQVDEVICGDAYLVNGQSNALAADYHNEGLSNSAQSRWIRSYGSSTRVAAEVVLDDVWHLADGALGNDSGTVGTWALRAARILVDRYQIPIAMMNGSVGGTALYLHKRDDLNPENLDTIYGRLLYRARRAGVDQDVRAILWHQGENNVGTDPEAYLRSYGELLGQWHEDFPALEHVFSFQVRRGCSIRDVGIREAQRQFPDHFPEVIALPTTAINAHDGCHFKYAGYNKMGLWMGAAMSAALFGDAPPRQAVPPNVDHARFTNSARDQIEILFRHPGHVLHLDPGIEDRLVLGDDAKEVVVKASTTPGRILLQLSAPTSATTLAFIGHARQGPWITNNFGVGAFTFEVPILP